MSRLTRPQLAAYAAIAVLVLVLGGHWLAKRGGAASSSSSSDARAAYTAQDAAAGSGGETGSSTPPVTAPSRAAIVDVAGAVRHPGVYKLPSGARVLDAVHRAGGATAKGDVEAINLAALVQDGVQIVVPRRMPGGTTAIAAGAPGVPGAPPAAPVSLNTATAEQLDTLDGVGPATAQKILEYRQQHGGFRSVDDLGQVPGIGPKKLAALRGKVQV